jgi:hypothetical protein
MTGDRVVVAAIRASKRTLTVTGATRQRKGATYRTGELCRGGLLALSLTTVTGSTTCSLPLSLLRLLRHQRSTLTGTDAGTNALDLLLLLRPLCSTLSDTHTLCLLLLLRPLSTTLTGTETVGLLLLIRADTNTNTPSYRGNRTHTG